MIRVSMVEKASGKITPAVAVTDALVAIRNGKYRQTVSVIRKRYAEALEQTGDYNVAKRSIDPLKRELPGILFNGTFSCRGDKNLLEYSGLLCADLDNLSEGQKADARQKFTSDPHVFALFESPTGTGLKVVFAVEKDVTRHPANFAAVKNHVQVLCGLAVDESCRNLERLCFVSADPQLYMNQAAMPLPIANDNDPNDNDATEAKSRDVGCLIQKFGPPYYKDGEGKFASLNESFWAGLYADENIVLYEPDERCFYVYDAKTGLYRPESEAAIKCKLSERMLDASRQSNQIAIQRKRTASTLNNILSHLRGIAEHRGAFKQRPPIVHLANGIIVFRSGDADFVEFSPDFYSRNASPIRYDPDARCDRFLNELILPAVHPEDLLLLQKISGMYLLGYNRAQRMLILDGESGRGKTQLANVFQGIIGHVNCTQLRTRHLGERFETFRFLRKILLIGVDVDPAFLSTKGAAELKGLVGGDWFDAEQKGGTGSFQMQGVFNVCITSNARLKVRLCGDVSAWCRRLIIIRFEGPPPKTKIPDFGSYLVRTEGSGILNFMLKGAALLLQDIPDEGGDIDLTERQRGIIDALLAESDSLRNFLMECIVSAADSDLTVREVVEAYASYCPNKGWKPLPVTEVYDSLEGLMLELFTVSKSHSVKREDGGGQRGFRGVRFRNEPRRSQA
jgi:phage/plasmid-associated DNA primase